MSGELEQWFGRELKAAKGTLEYWQEAAELADGECKLANAECKTLRERIAELEAELRQQKTYANNEHALRLQTDAEDAELRREILGRVTEIRKDLNELEQRAKGGV